MNFGDNPKAVSPDVFWAHGDLRDQRAAMAPGPRGMCKAIGGGVGSRGSQAP